MSARPIEIALSPASDRRQPLLDNSDYSSRGGVRNARLAEVVGGTTAECAAVCCCGPCGLFNLLVLAVYKVPAGLCRKALRRKRRRRLLKMQGALPPLSGENELHVHSMTQTVAMVDAMETKEVIELDREMMERFDRGGFWRSASRSSEVEAK